MDHRVRLRAEYRNHLWSCDFVHHRTADGRAFRTLNIPDGHSRECPFSADLAVPNRLPGNGTIRAKRKPNSTEVIDALTDLFILRGVPAYIRSDNGPEFIAGAVRDWIKAVRAKTAYIEPRSPRENGYCASFNRRMRDELLNGEIFNPLREARIIVERCRKHSNTKRSHSAPGYRPPGPEALIPMEQRPIMHQLSNRTTQVGRLNVGCSADDIRDYSLAVGMVGYHLKIERSRQFCRLACVGCDLLPTRKTVWISRQQTRTGTACIGRQHCVDVCVAEINVCRKRTLRIGGVGTPRRTCQPSGIDGVLCACRDGE